MRLTELQAHLFRFESRIETYQVCDGDPATWNERGRPVKEVTGPRTYLHHVKVMAEAQGVMMLCPLCFQKNGGDRGTHWIRVPFAGRGVTDEQAMHDDQGKPVCWEVSGASLEDLSTAPSILLLGGCGWHGYITHGDAA